MVYIYCILFIQFIVDGHVGQFHVCYSEYCYKEHMDGCVFIVG